MKDYDQERKGARPDNAPQQKVSAKPVDAKGVEGALHQSISVTKTDAGGDARPDILRHEQLSHPANAGQLADILSGLQQSYGNAYVQQVVSGMNEPKPDVEATTSAGQKLDAGVKAEMESAFGESFAEVRVHTDNEAEKMNEELGAHAVTRGRDIYFDRGEYDPSSVEGKELLAHELAHIVQQAGGSAHQRANSVNQPGDKFEEEAERAARAVINGERAPVLQRSAAPSFQRQARTGGQTRQPQNGIDLDHQPHGTLADGVTYSYDPHAHRLTLTGHHLSVSPPQGGSLVSDSARGAMAPPRIQTVIIQISSIPLTVSVNGHEYRFIRYQGTA